MFKEFSVYNYNSGDPAFIREPAFNLENTVLGVSNSLRAASTA